MRIVAGTAKGTPLNSIDGENTRPTLDRIKENFFNAIAFDLEDAKVLDLFAGSGQLGLEALSRGAKEAIFVDSNIECIEVIKKNAQKAKLFAQCNIFHSDYLEYLSALKKRRGFDKLDKFNIVFLDPPYDTNIIKDIVKKLIKQGYIADGGIIICESENSEIAFDADVEESFEQVKVYKYGKVYITVVKLKVNMANTNIDIDGEENE